MGLAKFQNVIRWDQIGVWAGAFVLTAILILAVFWLLGRKARDSN